MDRYGLFHDAERMRRIVELRNELFHEALWVGGTPGTGGGEDEWERLTLVDLKIIVHAILILDGRRLIIGTDKGVHVSKNGGKTWAAWSELPAGTTTYALAYESSTNRIYAGGNNGIFSMPVP